MLTFAGFFAPYLFALAAFPVLVRLGSFLWMVPVCACILMMSSPWLIPPESAMLRFIASISAAMLALKVIDVSHDLALQRQVTWRAYVDFLTNPFTHVRRSLPLERSPSPRENFQRFLVGSVTCAVAVTALMACFKFDWLGVPFLIEHVTKVSALMVAISSGLTCAAATWRLSGGTARDFMDRPFIARTPAEFWRRYNRNVQQFFWQDVFSGSRSRRAPLRTMLFIFALSALLHELVFLAAVGHVQGYQTTFFAIQGLAAVSTARVKMRGKTVIAWVACTLAFNLLTSVLFFASLQSMTPFYSRGLPVWLQGW